MTSRLTEDVLDQLRSRRTTALCGSRSTDFVAPLAVHNLPFPLTTAPHVIAQEGVDLYGMESMFIQALATCPSTPDIRVMGVREFQCLMQPGSSMLAALHQAYAQLCYIIGLSFIWVPVSCPRMCQLLCPTSIGIDQQTRGTSRHRELFGERAFGIWITVVVNVKTARWFVLNNSGATVLSEYFSVRLDLSGSSSLNGKVCTSPYSSPRINFISRKFLLILYYL